VRNSKDAFIIVTPFILWACMVIFAYALTVLELKAVRHRQQRAVCTADTCVLHRVAMRVCSTLAGISAPQPHPTCRRPAVCMSRVIAGTVAAR
jgi:hypothetical protein